MKVLWMAEKVACGRCNERDITVLVSDDDRERFITAAYNKERTTVDVVITEEIIHSVTGFLYVDIAPHKDGLYGGVLEVAQ